MKWEPISVSISAVIALCTIILTFFSVRVALASSQYRQFQWKRRVRSRTRRLAKKAVKQVVATTPIDDLDESSILIFSLSPKETALVKQVNAFLGPKHDDLVRLLLMHGIRCASDQVKPGMAGLAATHYWLLDPDPELRHGLPPDAVENTRNFATGFMSGLDEESGNDRNDDSSASSQCIGAMESARTDQADENSDGRDKDCDDL